MTSYQHATILSVSGTFFCINSVVNEIIIIIIKIYKY